MHSCALGTQLRLLVPVQAEREAHAQTQQQLAEARAEFAEQAAAEKRGMQEDIDSLQQQLEQVRIVEAQPSSAMEACFSAAFSVTALIWVGVKETEHQQVNVLIEQALCDALPAAATRAGEHWGCTRVGCTARGRSLLQPSCACNGTAYSCDSSSSAAALTSL